MVKVGKLGVAILSSFVVTQIILDVANTINTTGNTILASMVTVGKYILMVVVILFALNQAEKSGGV